MIIANQPYVYTGSMQRFYLLTFLFIICACNNPFQDRNPAEVNSNGKVVSPGKSNLQQLPDELNEISGITFMNDSVLVAIQDEQGILYYYNLRQNKIIKKQTFAGEGDYEDLVRVGHDMYVVSSSGVITCITNFASANPTVKTYRTPFTEKNDIEGLGYDSKRSVLLMAPKEHGLDKDKGSKHIYAFDLATMSFQPKPLYVIRLAEIEDQFRGNALEESSKKFLKALGNENMNKVFRSSGITVNERTREVFILSSLNGLILVLSPDGALSKILQFRGPEFTQPEGIAFSHSGKLYVSNEGGKSGVGNIIEIIHEK